MGLFYSNLTVHGTSRESLLAELRRLGRDAFVSATFDGYSVVFDRLTEEQDFELIEDLGTAITKALSCAALAAVLHDDDVLYLWLFQNGELKDHYNSSPAYFDADSEPLPPAGGNADLLCKAFSRHDHRERMAELLRADLLEEELPDVLGELERHIAIAAELGMPRFVAGVCYSSIEGNYVPREFLEPDFVGIKFEAV